MCIAIPKKIVAIETFNDIRRATVRRQDCDEIVSLVMTPQAQVGDVILVFQGNALRIVSETEAERIEAALCCLGQVQQGEHYNESLQKGFGDLIEKPAQLPPHLQAIVGKKLLKD